MPYPQEKCYPVASKGLTIAGYALLAIGILIVFLCIPAWAWLALLGVALMAAGFALLPINHAGR